MANSWIAKYGQWQQCTLNNYSNRESYIKAVTDHVYNNCPVGVYNLATYGQYTFVGFYRKTTSGSVNIFLTRPEENQTYIISVDDDNTSRHFFRIASTEVWNT